MLENDSDFLRQLDKISHYEGIVTCNGIPVTEASLDLTHNEFETNRMHARITLMLELPGITLNPLGLWGEQEDVRFHFSI